MRRLSLFAVLLLSTLCFACAHASADTLDPGASPGVDAAGQAAAADTSLEPDADPSGIDPAIASGAGAGAGATVISFEEGGDDMLDAVVAPPKREDIPGFELFGTGETASTPGPKLTLPPDME